ncbi:MAG TPA: hypothetical protein VFK38_02680 [Candidatus Limnocylindrales bacterium]|nr:hypothetical protein [Candidatus Limnocylindrales bacterium]
MARDLARLVVPPEARRHFRAAMREQLLGARAMLDHWLRQLQESEERPRDVERIRID